MVGCELLCESKLVEQAWLLLCLITSVATISAESVSGGGGAGGGGAGDGPGGSGGGGGGSGSGGFFGLWGAYLSALNSNPVSPVVASHFATE